MPEQLILTVIASVITGAISAVATVKALGVHITYLRESITRHEQAIERAHQRIDHLEKWPRGALK